MQTRSRPRLAASVRPSPDHANFRSPSACFAFVVRINLDSLHLATGCGVEQHSLSVILGEQGVYRRGWGLACSFFDANRTVVSFPVPIFHTRASRGIVGHDQKVGVVPGRKPEREECNALWEAGLRFRPTHSHFLPI